MSLATQDAKGGLTYFNGGEKITLFTIVIFTSH
jgi:hypothetical protein